VALYAGQALQNYTIINTAHKGISGARLKLDKRARYENEDEP